MVGAFMGVKLFRQQHHIAVAADKRDQVVASDRRRVAARQFKLVVAAAAAGADGVDNADAGVADHRIGDLRRCKRQRVIHFDADGQSGESESVTGDDINAVVVSRTRPRRGQVQPDAGVAVGVRFGNLVVVARGHRAVRDAAERVGVDLGAAARRRRQEYILTRAVRRHRRLRPIIGERYRPAHRHGKVDVKIADAV